MEDTDLYAFYRAGAAVAAYKFGITVKRIAIGDDNGLNGETKLEPLEACDLDVGRSFFKAILVEDYVTTLLSGPAGHFIRVQDRHCHLKRSFGNAGIELEFLQQVWKCLQPEPDRAAAIIVASLNEYDDGNVEATMMRLARRAVRILRSEPHYSRLKKLARKLLAVKHMTGAELTRFLKNC